MPYELTKLQALFDLPFDQVIDVRSPAEFAVDHIPGAVNLPALSDEERAHVGTVYVQDSPFKARKIGAALVSRNVARHLEGPLADKPKGWTPLVYCWRGGQRSGSVALVLRQVGWQAETIDGGYRAYRRMVQSYLYDTTWPGPVVVLDGNTGTAKTDLLHLLARDGRQVIDLEGLANHRGSHFGAVEGGQPSQRMFETQLALAMAKCDPGVPLVVEAESSRIGHVNLPPAIWDAMKSAPRVVVSAPLAERATYLMTRYPDAIGNDAKLTAAIEALRPYRPATQIEAWHQMARSGALTDLAAQLMRDHYDPAYARQRARFSDVPTEALPLDRLDDQALAAAMPALQAMIDRLSPA